MTAVGSAQQVSPLVPFLSEERCLVELAVLVGLKTKLVRGWEGVFWAARALIATRLAA